MREKLWKILCKPVENFLILVLFPSFNAYETVDKFETSGEEPVPSQPALQDIFAFENVSYNSPYLQLICL